MREGLALGLALFCAGALHAANPSAKDALKAAGRSGAKCASGQNPGPAGLGGFA